MASWRACMKVVSRPHTMGNQASSGLPFNVGEAIHAFQRPVPWQLHYGTKKDNGLEVSVFRLNKTSAGVGPTAMAQHSIQKLRTLRHPNILTYVDSADLEDAVVLVTERVLPLRSWLQSLPPMHALDQLTWGLKNIGNAVSFLQSKCNMLHGALSLDAIFVTPGGDWTLGGMDLIVALPAEKAYFTDRESVLQEQYRSPERRARDWTILDDPELGVRIDTYSFGKVIEEVFQLASVSRSKPLLSLTERMTRDAPHQRILMQQFMKCPAFESEYVRFMTALDEISIKSPAEKCTILAELGPKLAGFPPHICSSKIAPALLRVVELSLADYNTNRETARAALALGIPSLAQVAVHLPNDTFRRKYQPVILPLWSLNDRTIRSVLLQTLRLFAPSLDDDSINKKVLDPMLNGFADTAMKMRELTLKSLVHITDRLDERAMNDRLLRCLTKLQSDSEPSIRTNTTIFVGKIAAKLKPGTRARALPPTFLKAMKDPFSHARLAGAKATQACLSFFDSSTLALKFLPALSCLAVDKAGSVREVALQCCETILLKLKEAHEEATKQEEADLLKKQAEIRAKQPVEALPAHIISGSGKTEEHTNTANEVASDEWSSCGTVPPAGEVVRGSPAASHDVSVSSFDGWDDFAIDDEDPLSPSVSETPRAGPIADGWGDGDEEWEWEGDVDSKPAMSRSPQSTRAVPAKADAQPQTSVPQASARVGIPQLAAAPGKADAQQQVYPPQTAARVSVPQLTAAPAKADVHAQPSLPQTTARIPQLTAVPSAAQVKGQAVQPPQFNPAPSKQQLQAPVPAFRASSAKTPTAGGVSTVKEVKGMKLGQTSGNIEAPTVKKRERLVAKKLDTTADDWDDF